MRKKFVYSNFPAIVLGSIRGLKISVKEQKLLVA